MKDLFRDDDDRRPTRNKYNLDLHLLWQTNRTWST